MAIKVSSPAFLRGDMIPIRYTCDGEDISPPIIWDNIPPNANSITLILEDLDAPGGIFVHWVIYNIPVSFMKGLKEGIPKIPILPDRSRQGLNDFKKIGYGSPCPPPGMPHRYIFTIFALDTSLLLPPGVTKYDVETAMQGHILDTGPLVAIYRRQ